MKQFIGFIVWVTLLFPCASFADSVSGKVYATDGPRILIIETQNQNRPFVAVTNYTGTNATLNRHISVIGKRVGNYNYGNMPIELWEPQTSIDARAKEAPAEVAQAHSKVVEAARQLYAKSLQVVALQKAQTQRAAAHLEEDPATTLSIKKLNEERSVLAQKLAEAQQEEYTVRERYRLPPGTPKNK